MSKKSQECCFNFNNCNIFNVFKHESVTNSNKADIHYLEPKYMLVLMRPSNILLASLHRNSRICSTTFETI
jgi:hypothetical protein